jgi:hypothetical protein
MADEASTPLSDYPSIEIFLLPGLHAETSSFYVGNIRVSKLSYTEFSLFEKGMYLDDIGDVFHTNGRVPYFAIFAGESVDDELRDARTRERERLVTRLARACWLHAGAALFDPSEHIRYRRDGFIVLRKPRICGRSYVGVYAEHKLSGADIDEINALYQQLEHIETRNDLPEQLRISEILYGKIFRVTAFDPDYKCDILLSILMLLVSDDRAVLNEMSRNSAFADFHVAEILQSRDLVAHGATEPTSEMLTRLEGLVRCLIKYGLSWSIDHPGARTIDGAALVRHVIDGGRAPGVQIRSPASSHGVATATIGRPASRGDEELEFEQSQADVAFESAVEIAGMVVVQEAGLRDRIAARLTRMFGKSAKQEKITDVYLSDRDIERAQERASKCLKRALSQYEKKKLKAADKSLAECIAQARMVETILGDDSSDDVACQFTLFMAHSMRGDILDEWKQPADAMSEMALAERAFEKLPTAAAEKLQHRFIEVLCNFAMFASKVPDLKTGLAKAEKAHRLAQLLADTDENRSMRARVLNCLAIRQSQAGLKEAALNTARAGHELARALFARDRGFAFDYGAALNTLARRYAENGDEDKARFLLRKAAQQPIEIVEGAW